ncbi:MAG: Glucosaminyl phosphatidylinositol (GlcN-PI) nositol acylation protein [Bogoriella megaspora]|nr:MAG: Glucosaminyl phosphatidylinositol (GlcN-PI) nositol acylation protein [Bogoriella megaspora]
MEQEYKAVKEDFVSNLSGSSVWEVYKVSLVAPSGVLLWSALQSQHAFFTPYTPSACLIDFILNCLSILYATTLYSSAPLLLNALLLVPPTIFYAIGTAGRLSAKRAKLARSNEKKDTSTSAASRKDILPVKPFITSYRGCMIVVTCVAILAVDFRIFPRRFAKVETWGTSLMDMGQGSFVFTAGVVGARSVLKERMSSKSQPFGKRLIGGLRHALPLWILGLLRLYSVKKVDYAEHVTEYGVHWNFFFTLALLPPFTAVAQAFAGSKYTLTAFSLLVTVAYEAVLDFTDLKKFILTAPRTDLFSQNREGIFSFFGYLSIALAGQATGMYIIPREESLPSSGSIVNSLRQSSVLSQLARWSVFWAIMFFATSSVYGPSLDVSRRLANMPYVLWVISFNTMQLLCFGGTEKIFFPDIYKSEDQTLEKRRIKEATSRVLHAFNRNGLAIFLVANLLTGLVNLTVATIYMPHAQSMGILIAYISVLQPYGRLRSRPLRLRVNPYETSLAYHSGLQLHAEGSKMSTPPSKRPRLSHPSTSVNKPFRSPLRATAQAKNPPVNASNLRKSTIAPSISKATEPENQHPINEDIQSDPPATPDAPPIPSPPACTVRKPPPRTSRRSLGANSRSTSRTKFLNDPEIQKLRKENTALEARIRAIQAETDTLRQACGILKTRQNNSSHGQLKRQKRRDAEGLEELTQKWRGAARQAAEEVFGTIRERVNRMGGVGAWREEEKRRRAWRGGWDEGEMDCNEKGDGEDEEEDDENGVGEGKREVDLGRRAEMEARKEELEAEKRIREDDVEEAVEGEETRKDDPAIEEGRDDDTFTMDMMLRSLAIDLDVIGYDREAQRWADGI